MEESTFDPGRRRLCPDGGCVGLIGDDGRCKVCGLAATGPAPTGRETFPPLFSVGGGDDSVADDQAAAVDPVEADAVTTTGDAGDFDPRRRLCDDGTCLGVIGADGACSVCGRRGA